jgi:hypothetical protein
MKDLAPLNYPIHLNISVGGRGYAGTWRELKTRHGIRFGLFTFKERGTARTIALFPPPATRNAKTQEG